MSRTVVEHSGPSRVRILSMLVLTTFFWGGSFLFTKIGVAELAPQWFVFFRFLIATIIMLPVVALLLLTNFAIGVITRSAPQLNLFSFGFPMTLMVVFVALYLFATPLGYAMQEVSEFSLEFVAGFLTGLANGQ